MKRVSDKELKEIIEAAKWDFFNTERTFDEVLQSALSLTMEKMVETHIRETTNMAATYGEQFECDNQQ